MRIRRVTVILGALIACTFMAGLTWGYSGGSGTAQNPYRIANVDDLAQLGSTPGDQNKCFVLAKDIDLAGKTWPAAVIPAFTGTFDGNGFTIQNLTIIGNAGQTTLGLFGSIGSTGRVLNAGLANVNVSGTGVSNIGALAGTNSGTVTNCFCVGAVTCAGPAVEVGGLIGSNSSGSNRVSNCFSAVNVSGTTTGNWCDMGGLIGLMDSGVLASCYSTATVAGTPSGVGWFGGLVGHIHQGTVVNCYSAGAVSGSGGGNWGSDLGGLVGYAGATGSVSVGYCYSCAKVSNRSQYKVGGLAGSADVVPPFGKIAVSNCFWDAQVSGVSVSAWGTGLATAQMKDPNTYLKAGWDFGGETINGTQDIWKMPKAGGYPQFSWQGDTVMPPPSAPWGYSGGCGTPQDPYRIANVNDLTQMGSSSVDRSKCFILVKDIDLAGTTWSTAVVPLFFGTFDGNNLTIRHLTIKGKDNCLGLFGFISGNGARVLNTRVVDVDMAGGVYVGALAGQTCYGSTVTNCLCSGVVTGQTVGGLVGVNGGTSSISNCSFAGEVTFFYSSGADSAGGLVAANFGTISDCLSAANVTGWTGASFLEVGGLVGWNGRDESHTGHVVNCCNTGAVTGGGDSGCTVYAGGLVGDNSGYVASSCNSGVVSGKGAAGSSVYVGGLMGETVGGTTVNCYSQGTVSGPGISGSYAGGLIGLVSIWADPDTSIADCYSAAQVANMNPGQLGGLVGSWQCSAPVSQAVTRCFWDKDASGCGSSPGGTGLTTAQMKDISTYLRVGWDFVGETTNGTEDIWKMPKFGGYPLLFWQEDKSTPAPPPPPAPTVEGFETKNFLACDWKRSGDQDWYITSDQKHSGLFSARAGTIGDDQTSTLELTRNCQAGKLSFFVKVSSESGPDRLVFTMDGQFIGDWSGEVGWMQASYSVPAGVHTFDWTYSKDDANDAGFDTAWLDDITFPPSQ